MITFTSAQLNAWLAAFLWPLARILSLIATAPVFNQPNFPTIAKIGLASLLAIIVAPTLGPLPSVSVGSFAGLLILLQQMLIGVSFGMVMQLVFTAAQAAGEFAGLQMGLSFAQLITPTATDGSTLVLSNLMNVFCTLIFLALDGHLRLISALVDSFSTLPISTINVQPHGFETVAAWGGSIFSGGLMLCLPVVAVILMANLAVGILNRAAPQVGVYQVGFAITLMVGMLMLLTTLPNMIPYLGQLVEQGFTTLYSTIADFSAS
jgi:flagellar biosynthetic protein FliR